MDGGCLWGLLNNLLYSLSAGKANLILTYIFTKLQLDTLYQHTTLLVFYSHNDALCDNKWVTSAHQQSNDSKFTGNSQTKPLSKMQLLKPPRTESIANTYSKKINTIILNIQPNSSPHKNTHKVVNDQTFRLDNLINLIISPTPIPSSQPSGQVSSTCTHCLLPWIEAFGIHGRSLQSPPQFLFKKNAWHGSWEPQIFWLTGWHRNQGISKELWS